MEVEVRERYGQYSATEIFILEQEEEMIEKENEEREYEE